MIFPEAQRGTGEGHGAWDSRPQSTMTNATVAQTVAGVDGQGLTGKYKGEGKKIIVPWGGRGGRGCWHPRPKSTRTHAQVAQTVAGVDGQVLTVKYKGEEKKIIVP